MQYVSESADATVVFAYQVRGLRGAGVRRAQLRGLPPKQRYRREHDGAESTGAALMGAGIPLELVSPDEARIDWRSRIEVWRAI